MKKGIIACLSAFVLFSASVYAQDLNNYIESLAGKCPGLIVIDNDAMPGSGVPSLMVRGRRHIQYRQDICRWIRGSE